MDLLDRALETLPRVAGLLVFGVGLAWVSLMAAATVYDLVQELFGSRR